MRHICETDQDHCAICLKFDRDKFRVRLEKAEKRVKELKEFVNTVREFMGALEMTPSSKAQERAQESGRRFWWEQVKLALAKYEFKGGK